MRKIEIEWLPIGIKVVAQLSDAPNRNLSDLLWDSLPYNSLQNHALVSGNHLYHLVPSVELVSMVPEHKEDRTLSQDGTLFLSQLQHLAIKYGPLSEYILAAPIGTVIPEHVPLLREAGQACWHATYHSKQIIEVRVRRLGVPDNALQLPRAVCVAPPEVLAVLRDIEDETQRAWLKPPQEVLDLHRGRIASGAGSYDQYFSTLVFLNGETRPLGYCALNGLVRLSQADNISLDMLCQIAPNFIRTPAEFLGYCGFNTLWHFTQATLRVLPLLQTKQQFWALFGALGLYAQVLNTWNLQYFPWRHGDQYPALGVVNAGSVAA